MRAFVRLSRGLLAAGLLAASAIGLGSCGSYALFKVQIHATRPTDLIDHCKISITDQNGKEVLPGYQLRVVTATDPTTGSVVVKSGCFGGITPEYVGDFSYSTSNINGTFQFTVNAYDGNGKLVQTATSNAVQAKPYPPEMPAIPLTMKPVSSN